VLARLFTLNTRERIMHHTVYRWPDISGLSVFYREAGPPDGPAILLLHGFPSSSRQWEPLLARLADAFHLIAPDNPGFGHSDAPDPAAFPYTFDHLAEITGRFTEQLGLDRYEAALRENIFSPAATRLRHVGISPVPEAYDPDLWTGELAFLGRPGQHDIQADLFYDYRTNVASDPAWQEWLRAHRPPLLVLWGRYDPSFEAAEADAYRRDVTEVHLLDAGHFALDEQPDRIAELTRQFLCTSLPS
jgi:pimeloyl-ACP methyl ester carboxylesterase